MPARKLRYLILFLVLFLILAFILSIWSARTYVAELVITSALQSSAGLKHVTMNITQLDQNKIQLPRFGFSLSTATGLLQFNVLDTSISYDLEQLADGRVNSIVINNLDLHYQDTDEIHADSTAEPASKLEKLQPVKIIDAMRSALAKYMVVNSLFIQHITLNGEPFSVLRGKEFQLKSTANNETLDNELSLLDKASVKQSVVLSLSADRLVAELRQTAGDMKPAKIELNIHDTFLTGNFYIRPQHLLNWLQDFDSQSVAVIDGLNDGVNKTESVNGNILFNFASDTQFLTTFTAESKKLIVKTVTADNVAIKLKIKNTKIYPLQRIQIQNGSYIKASYVRYRDLSLADSHIYMVGELTDYLNSWSYKGGLSSKLLAVNFGSGVIQLKDIAARIAANANQLNVSGNFSPAEFPAGFEFNLDHNLARGFGKLSIKHLTPLDLNARNNKLSLLLVSWPYPFDLLSGKIKLSSHASWSEKDDFKLTTAINVDNAGGNVGDLLFSGLSFDHELQILPKLHTISAGKIALKHVDSGIIADNISTALRIITESSDSLPQVILHDLFGEIFGGNFSADDLVYDLNSSTNNFMIKATNIDLAEIVKTQQLEGIEATGRIDGIIPVKLNEKGIFIEDGVFINDVRNGTIRYNPATGTEQLKQNPITGIALDALRDFRYSYLSAGVNFTPEGRLKINLQLKGSSPELDSKRPVHLNINTEQNLLSLLKSLRYAQGVSEKIDNKVRRLYEKNQK
jgi:hypothetical protein